MAWDDVLDHLGLVPRELGPLQVCLTKVLRGAAGVRVELYLQAAIDPLPPTALRLRWVDAAGAPASSDVSVEVPPLPGGRVLRLVLAPDPVAKAAKLELRVAAEPVKGKPQRVRPAWKLLATHEQQREERASGAGGDVSVLGANLLTLPLGVLVLPSIGQTVTTRTPGKVHAAPPSPEFVEAVIETAEQLPQPEVVEVWREGQPLPALAAAAPLVAPEVAAAPTGERRTCSSCGYRDVPNSKLCPACGAFWD